MNEPNLNTGGKSIDEIADSFVARLRNGQHPSINEYVERFPQHAEEIRELLPTLAALEDMQPGRETNGSVRALGNQFKPRDKIGEYEIVREIGRGGMGIVFEARHEQMRRRVALKVLPASVAQIESNVKRFHREARAAGQLHHSNIVPVFEVGHNDEIYYYAMQYIHGQNLDLVIDELRWMQGSNGRTLLVEAARTRNNDLSIAKSLAMGEFESPLEDDPDKETAVAIDASFPVEHEQQSKPVSERHPPALRQEQNDKATDDTEYQKNNSAVPDSGLDSLGSRLLDSTSSGKSPSGSQRFGRSGSQWSTIGDEKESYYSRIARVGLQVADALDYAHQHGVVHRDIKPSNLILDTEGIVWVTDFGLAKEEGDNLTHTGDIVGTLRYMAPERFHRPADARSDIYSLGLTLYELCTLKHAFDHHDRAHLVKQICEHNPVAPRRIRPDVPRDLETIVLKAIDREPHRRYQSAREISNDLRRFIADRPIAARRVSIGERAWRWCRRNPTPAVLAACIVLLLVAGAIGLGRFAYVTANHAKELERGYQQNQGHLYRAQFNSGTALRWSGRQGQNFESRKALAFAASLIPSIGRTNEINERLRYKLRIETAASMALLDLNPVKSWNVPHRDLGATAFDSKLVRYAQGDAKGNIAIKILNDHQEQFILPSPGERAWEIEFSPNGKFLIAKYHHSLRPAETTVCLWDLSSASRLLMINEEVSGRFEFLPDSAQVSLGRTTGKLEFYSTVDGSLVKTLNFEKQQPFMWHFNREQTHFAIVTAPLGSVSVNSGNNEISLRRLADGEVESAIPTPGEVTSFQWNDQRNQIAAACRDNLIYVWNSFTKDSLQPDLKLRGHTNTITRLALRNRGDILLSDSWDGSTRMFDLSTGEQVLRVEGMRLAGKFDASDMRVPCRNKQTEMGIWELPNDRPYQAFHLGETKSSRHACVFHPIYDQVGFYPSTHGLDIIDFQTDHHQRFTIGGLLQVYISPNAETMYTSGENGFQKWSLETDNSDPQKVQIKIKLVETILPDKSDRFDISPDQKVIAVRMHRSFYFNRIDCDSGEVLRIGDHHRLAYVTLSRCSRYAFTNTWQGNGIKVWSAIDGQLIDTILPEISTCAVAPYPDGVHLYVQTGTDRYKIHIESLEVVETWERKQPDGWAGSAVFSPDGKTMMTAYSRFRPQILDVQTGEPLVILESPDPITVGAVSVSSNGRFCAFAEKSEIRMWDLWQLRRNFRQLGIDWDEHSKLESHNNPRAISISIDQPPGQ